MSKDRSVCPHCGAVQKEGSTVCDLCGSMLDGSEIDEALETPEVAAAAVGADRESDRPATRGERAGKASRAGFCTNCGAPYPVGARFCGSCGEKILTLEPEADVEDRGQNPEGNEGDREEVAGIVSAGSASIPSVEKPKRAATDKELGRQVLLVVGASVILIVALFVITAVSRNGGSDSTGTSAATVDAVAAPLSPEVQASVASLRSEIDALSGDEKISKLRELSDFLISHGRWDVAAGVQAEIAEATGAESDWIRSGNLYYDWMDGVQDEAKVAYAKKAIESYQKALQINPDNLDVRTDMAIAYMFDPENTVQAIAQTNMVLDADSLHVQANFNRGIMLLQINRFDEAARQFNKVMRLVDDPENPIYQRAESALEAIRQAGI